jgi:hypothetical protein
MEAVYVFCGIDGFEDTLGVHLRRQRKLDEDAIDVVVAIQVSHNGEKFFGRGRCRRREKAAREAKLFARRDFAFYVELRGRVFAHKNRCEAGLDARSSKQPYLVL